MELYMGPPMGSVGKHESERSETLQIWAPGLVINGVINGPYKWPQTKWVTGVISPYLYGL